MSEKSNLDLILEIANLYGKYKTSAVVILKRALKERVSILVDGSDAIRPTFVEAEKKMHLLRLQKRIPPSICALENHLEEYKPLKFDGYKGKIEFDEYEGRLTMLEILRKNLGEKVAMEFFAIPQDNTIELREFYKNAKREHVGHWEK